jgi:hypothetical protein
MGTVPNSFMADVLAQIRAPQSAVSIGNLQTWQRYEGGTFTWNPLNVEEDGKVVDFPNAATGERITAETLQNGRYTAILVKLRAGAPLVSWNDPSVIEQINEWGTHDFAAYIETLTPPAPPAPPPPTGEDDMWLYQLTDGTIYLMQGGVKIQLGVGPDAEFYIANGTKLYMEAQWSPEYQATLAKIPVIA